MNETRIRRGLARSVMIAPIEAVSSVGLSLLLIGIFAREGGMPLVGQWAMLQAYLVIALAFDLGVAYGVSRHVATTNPAAGFALVARAAAWPVGIGGLCILAALGSVGIGATGWVFSGAVALAAGAVQLLAQWFGAIQTGAHRHVLNQAAGIFLSIAQFALALAALWFFDAPSMPALAVAVLTARALHLLLMLALLWFSPLGFRDWLRAPGRASWRAVWETASGFTLFTLALKWRVPVLRLSVGFLGGDAALGAFAIAQRAPEAIAGVFSSGLQTMLSGFAGIGGGAAAARLVGRGLEVQVALCLPLFFAFIAHAPAILLIWIGEAGGDLVLMTRLMGLAGIVGAVALPFFWALQAAGAANFLAAIFAGQTVLIVAIGAIGFQFAGWGVFVFVAAFAVLSAATDLVYLARAVRRIFGFAVIRDWFRTRRVWLVVALNIAAAWASTAGAETPGLVELLLRIALYGAVSAAISWVAFRR